MDRRKALKKIGLTTGFIVVTPGVLNLLQSCTRQSTLEWKPVFFSDPEAAVLQDLIDKILPKTEKYPGALELNIPQFIDAYLNEVSKPKEQQHFKKGIGSVLKTIKKENLNAEELLQKQLSDKNSPLFAILSDIRKMSVWAYMTTEEVGERVLAYDPVPGVYIPCLTLEEATGGKAWSIPF